MDLCIYYARTEVGPDAKADLVGKWILSCSSHHLTDHKTDRKTNHKTDHYTDHQWRPGGLGVPDRGQDQGQIGPGVPDRGQDRAHSGRGVPDQGQDRGPQWSGSEGA